MDSIYRTTGLFTIYKWHSNLHNSGPFVLISPAYKTNAQLLTILLNADDHLVNLIFLL